MQLLLIALFLLQPAGDPTTSWPRFRGPNGSGIASGFVWPNVWDQQAIRWKVSLPGQGHGSPIIHTGRIFLQAATTDSRVVLCLSCKDGSTLWQRKVAGHVTRMHKKNTLASGSGATDGERVYFCHWDGEAVTLAAYQCIDGTPVWSVAIGPHESQHGAGYSPIVHEGKVVVAYDTDTLAEVICCDAETGKKLWSQPRKVFRASYGTPLVRQGRGGDEFVVASTAGITGYDVKSGEIVWDWVWPFQKTPLRVVSSPVLCPDNLLLAATGDGGGDRDTVAVKLPSADTTHGTGVRLRWQLRRDVPYVSCLLQHGDCVFYVADKGVAGCLDLETGKERWAQRLGGNFTSSPILVDSRIVVCNEEGDLFVFAADGKGYQPTARLRLGQQVYATPAVADGKLFVRTQSHLLCIGAKP
jgi:outer membrane protein assembly factor BamB